MSTGCEARALPSVDHPFHGSGPGPGDRPRPPRSTEPWSRSRCSRATSSRCLPVLVAAAWYSPTHPATGSSSRRWRSPPVQVGIGRALGRGAASTFDECHPRFGVIAPSASSMAASRAAPDAGAGVVASSWRRTNGSSSTASGSRRPPRASRSTRSAGTASPDAAPSPTSRSRVAAGLLSFAELRATVGREPLDRHRVWRARRSPSPGSGAGRVPRGRDGARLELAADLASAAQPTRDRPVVLIREPARDRGPLDRGGRLDVRVPAEAAPQRTAAAPRGRRASAGLRTSAPRPVLRGGRGDHRRASTWCVTRMHDRTRSRTTVPATPAIALWTLEQPAWWPAWAPSAADSDRAATLG